MTLLFTNVYAQDPIKIMLYGDSLMAGYGLSQKENLSSELTRSFQRERASNQVYQRKHLWKYFKEWVIKS